MDEITNIKQNNTDENLPQYNSPQPIIEKGSSSSPKNKLYLRLGLIILILLCILTIIGIFFVTRTNNSFSVNRTYIGEWITPNKNPVQAKVTILSIEKDQIILLYSWGSDSSGGHAKINAKRLSEKTFEWVGYGASPPKFTLNIEKDGTLKGIRQQSSTISTILMK